jgi:hypothetical protein
MSFSRFVGVLFIYLVFSYIVQSLCTVSQFICHISAVRCRTVQFSKNNLPDDNCSLVQSNTTVYLSN